MDMFIPGTYGNGALLAQVVLTRAVSFSDEFAGARAYAGVTATTETDHPIIAVYTALDDASELWDLIPMMEFLIENAADPNRISSWWRASTGSGSGCAGPGPRTRSPAPT